MLDTIVIGYGPAGVSAAIYLKRFNLDVLIIGLKNSSLNQNIYIDNYYGLSHIKGNDLFNQGLNQLEDLKINHLEEEVIKIEIGNGSYKVITTNGEYESKTLFLGLGKPHKIKIKGVNDLIGKGVSLCAICDGYIYRGKTLALIGEGSFADSEYETLLRFTKDITRYKKADEIKKIDNKLIVSSDNKEQEFDGVFIAEGVMDSSSLSKHLGLLENELGYIEVNNNLQTNLEGVYAGGDSIGEPFQVAKAVENGMKAAINIIKYLK